MNNEQLSKIAMEEFKEAYGIDNDLSLSEQHRFTLGFKSGYNYPKWVSVETAPLLYKEVLGYCKNSDDQDCFLFCEIDEEGNFTDREGYFVGITHWQPLPPAPTK